eukprot:SAG22_NODE_18_length_32591_cov_38.043549_25_plen_76_part_00
MDFFSTHLLDPQLEPGAGHGAHHGLGSPVVVVRLQLGQHHRRLRAEAAADADPQPAVTTPAGKAAGARPHGKALS